MNTVFSSLGFADTILGFVFLAVAFILLRFSVMLIRLAFSDTKDVAEASGSTLSVITGSVPARKGGRRDPMVYAGVAYSAKRKTEIGQGFIADEVIEGQVRKL